MLLNRFFTWSFIIVFSISFSLCTKKQSAVGVLLKSNEGWVQMSRYNWDSMFAKGYIGTETLSLDTFPKSNGNVKIKIIDVPIDPSSLYLGRNVKKKQFDLLSSTMDKVPIPVIKRAEKEYELTLLNLPIGYYALVNKLSAYDYNAYFFQVVK